jgi:hypothetical protein
MTLAEFMRLNGLDDKTFTARLRATGMKVDRSTVTRWRLGRTTPRPYYMHALIEATNRKVGAADLLVETRRASS